MPRCVAYSSELNLDSTSITLSAAESHHIARVLRAKEGQPVKVINGQGVVADTELVQPNPKACVLAVKLAKAVAQAPYELTLVQAVLKGKAMDGVVRMATELGVTTIQPVYTQHGDVPLSAFDGGNKVEKWRTVAMEACKQCENPWVPEICEGRNLSDWLGALSAEDPLVYGSLEPNSRDFRGWRETLEGAVEAGKPLAIAIGPEGDFTSEEYEHMRAKGGLAVLLGRCILRSETAAPALLAGLIATLPASS